MTNPEDKILALNRITREVHSAIPYHREKIQEYKDNSIAGVSEDDANEYFLNGIISDAEVAPEIRTMIKTIIEEYDQFKITKTEIDEMGEHYESK